MLIAAIVLYRNLALFTSLTTDDLRIGIFRVTTLCNISILIIGIVFAFLSAVDVITFSENGEKLFAMVLLSCIMVFIGIVSPKLPYLEDCTQNFRIYFISDGIAVYSLCINNF